MGNFGLNYEAHICMARHYSALLNVKHLCSDHYYCEGGTKIWTRLFQKNKNK